MIFIFFIFIIVVDQYYKYKMEKTLLHGITKSFCRDKIILMLVKNTGGAFGVLENNLKIIIRLSIIGLLCLSAYLLNILQYGEMYLVKVGMIFMIGGGTSNLIDRILKGYVVDFIYFNIKKFPVFNIADFFIIIGSIMIIIGAV
ncbi:signal peptidase II [Haloimpatiens myeolchijeotgali]|uniref:signal peptidase II n=1 Tax=Haloimpatiens sp. FM7330 TaxID=3298610 RepID=UPI003851444F